MGELTMTKKWLWLTIGVVVGLVAATSCTDKKTDVAKELIAADKDRPNPFNKGISDYKDRIERLEELTGSTPAEIGEVTLKYHSQLTGDNAMSCFQFMSAIITFTGSAGPSEDYEEAAKAFVGFVRTGALPR